MTLKPCDVQCSSAALTHARHFNIMPDQTAADSHSYTWAGAPPSLPYIVKTHTAALCKSVWENNVNVKATEPELVPTLTTTFRLCHCSLLVSFSFFFSCYSSLTVFSPHTRPSISDSAEWAGDKVTWLLLLWRLKICSPLLSSPLLISCTARWWGIQRREIKGAMTKKTWQRFKK